MGFVYLACPYWHEDEKIREERFEKATKAAAWMMTNWGYAVFSALSHTVTIAKVMKEKKGLNFWLEQDVEMLRHAEQMFILTLDGWKESEGVNYEIEVAEKIKLPMSLIVPDKMTLKPFFRTEYEVQ